MLKVSQVALLPDAAERLARLRAGTGLKLSDCCVLLAAQQSSAEAVATFDDRLAAAARKFTFDVLS
jgi:predicted nucleic acid-binding protein